MILNLKILFFALFAISVSLAQDRSFKIDYDNGVFLMDNKEFRYVSGSFHYWRAHPDSWRTKLRTMRAAGLNAVDIYVNWAIHHPKGDGTYVWTGIANLEEFIKIATDEDFYIILRPGPYICAEIDNGGLPYWLHTKYPNIKLRTSDQDYLKEIESYYSVLMTKMEPYFYGNGGKIIMVQVENEYAAYGCDEVYMEFLRDETLKYTKEAAILFTTDIPDGKAACGTVEGVYPTIDFGIGRDDTMNDLWETQRSLLPAGMGKGPLVNSEFYPGWLTHWGEENQRRDADAVAKTLKLMLEAGASVNIYMFFGGTNFGFSAGANNGDFGGYHSDITSYDYDAPMDEAGDPTSKYLKIFNVVNSYLDRPLIAIPEKVKKMILPSIELSPISLLVSEKSRKYLGTTFVPSEKTKTFEQLGQFSGFVLYETVLPEFERDPAILMVNGLRDRAIVMVDDLLVGVLSRQNAINSLPLSGSPGSKLQIFVENQGRINYAITDDVKGIVGSVTLQMYDGEVELKNWSMTGFELEDFTKFDELIEDVGSGSIPIHKSGVLSEGPVIFYAKFDIDDPILDTYMDPTGWGKGILYINGFNLGRYWPDVGPQITMYVPKEILLPANNQIVLLEYHKAPKTNIIKFTDIPSLDKQ